MYQPGTAKQVIEIDIRRQHDLFGGQPISCHGDRYGHNHCGLISLNVNLSTGAIDAHLAVRNQFLERLQQVPDFAVGLDSDGGLCLLDTRLIASADYLRQGAG